VVLGPRNCGKTALLKSVLKNEPYAAYIDCRAFDATTPATFVEALLTGVLPKLPQAAQDKWVQALPWLRDVFAAFKLQVTSKDGVASEALTFSAADAIRTLFAGKDSAASTPATLNKAYDALRYAFSD